MAGYGVAERKTARETKIKLHVCGDCGGPVDKGRVLCLTCADELFFAVVANQVETERG